MKRGAIVWRSNKARVWDVNLVEHDTMEDYQAETGRGSSVACWKENRGNTALGSMHIVRERNDPSDVIHEAVHLAATHARKIRRHAINHQAEESIAREVSDLIGYLFEFYGWEIVRKEGE